MSSKSAETDTSGTAGQPGRSLSITAGLTLFYIFSVVVLLAFSIGFLYWSVTDTLELDDQQFMHTKVGSLRTILGEHEENLAIRAEELRHEVVMEAGPQDTEQHFIFYSRILDQTGSVVIQTPGMADRIPSAAFPPPVGVDDNQVPMQRWKSAQGKDYWLVSAYARTGAGTLRLIQVALDDSVEEGLLRSYRLRSVAVLVVGTVFFAGIGVFVIRRRMQPLWTVTDMATRITPSKLHERLDVAGWPRELAAVAAGLNVLLARLEDSFSRLARFSSDLAHEFRTPIHIMMGQTEVGLSKERGPEEYRHLLESNLDELDRLARLVNSLLFLARAEDPRVRLERTQFDVRRELEAVRDFHEALAEDGGISILCQGEGKLDADPLLFRRAVTNIVSNALRHTPEGGNVTLAVSQPDEHSVVVSISDTGPGIAPEDLPHLFERFFRPERASFALAEGSGLGLAIAKSIVELHGGSVAVDSEEGRGTTIFLRFPASAPAAD